MGFQPPNKTLIYTWLWYYFQKLENLPGLSKHRSTKTHVHAYFCAHNSLPRQLQSRSCYLQSSSTGNLFQQNLLLFLQALSFLTWLELPSRHRQLWCLWRLRLGCCIGTYFVIILSPKPLSLSLPLLQSLVLPPSLLMNLPISCSIWGRIIPNNWSTLQHPRHSEFFLLKSTCFLWRSFSPDFLPSWSDQSHVISCINIFRCWFDWGLCIIILSSDLSLGGGHHNHHHHHLSSQCPYLHHHRCYFPLHLPQDANFLIKYLLSRSWLWADHYLWPTLEFEHLDHPHQEKLLPPCWLTILYELVKMC